MREPRTVSLLFAATAFAALTSCSRMSLAPLPQPPDAHIVEWTDSTEFIEEWYTCGPFPRRANSDGGPAHALLAHWTAPGLTKQAAAEALVSESHMTRLGPAGWVLRTLRDVEMSSADPLTGEVRSLDTRIIDFLEAYPEHSVDSEAYALALIETPGEETRHFLIGSDDGITVWLNGRVIHDSDAERPLVPDQDFAIARFRKGINVLLVRVTNYRGYWGFMLRMPVGGSGAPLPDMGDALDIL